MHSDNNSGIKNSNNILNDDGHEIDYWKAAEEKNIRESINLSHTERFKIMTVLMRIGNTLSRAKITHKKCLTIMEIMDEHLLKFWQSLNHLGINYIMVGGVAVNLHGYSRVTKDIDVWIEDTKDNRKAIRIGA